MGKPSVQWEHQFSVSEKIIARQVRGAGNGQNFSLSGITPSSVTKTKS